MFDGTSDSLEKGSARTSRIAIGRNQMITVQSEGAFEMEFATPRLITSMESKDILSLSYGKRKASSHHFSF